MDLTQSSPILEESQLSNRISSKTSNSMITILLLPSELLVMIFELYLEGVRAEAYYPRLCDLALVNKTWHSTIANTSAFWSLVIIDNPRQAEVALSRVGSRDLWLVCDRLSKGHLLFELLPRCRALTVRQYLSHGFSFQDIATTPLPRLKAIELRFGVFAPNTSLPSITPFPSLTRICLTNWSGMHQSFMEILRSSPKLQTALFDRSAVWRPPDNQAWNTAVARLSDLQELHLPRCTVEVQNHILESVELPSCSRLEMSLVFASPIHRSVAIEIPFFRNMRQSPTLLQLQLPSDDICNIILEDMGRKYSCLIRMDSGSGFGKTVAWTRWLGTVLKLSDEPVTLEVKYIGPYQLWWLQDDSRSVSKFIDQITTLPCITSIVVSQWHAFWGQILGHRSVDYAKLKRWRFQNLTHLTYTKWDDGIVEVIKRRYGFGMAESQSDSDSLPSRFQNIRIPGTLRGIRPDAAAELEDLVGPAAITWTSERASNEKEDTNRGLSTTLCSDDEEDIKEIQADIGNITRWVNDDSEVEDD